MNIRQKLTPDDMRERIVAVAHEHFVRVGYSKTAVADIAAAMGMSPANVYRFFSSKTAIKDAICAKLMDEIGVTIAAIAARQDPADEKLRAFFFAIHRHNKTQLTNEHRLHEMVEVAMAENWPAIEAHCDAMCALLAQVIAEGVTAGLFRPVDPVVFADTAFDACAKIIHPTLIAHCAHQDQEEQARRLTDLLLAALEP